MTRYAYSVQIQLPDGTFDMTSVGNLPEEFSVTDARNLVDSRIEDDGDGRYHVETSGDGHYSFDVVVKDGVVLD